MPRFTRRELLVTAVLTLAPSLTSAEAPDQSALKFEIYKVSSGRFRWRLKAGNNKTIATADESHVRKETCQSAIAQIMQNAAYATIDDLTVPVRGPK